TRAPRTKRGRVRAEQRRWSRAGTLEHRGTPGTSPRGWGDEGITNERRRTNDGMADGRLGPARGPAPLGSQGDSPGAARGRPRSGPRTWCSGTPGRLPPRCLRLLRAGGRFGSAVSRIFFRRRPPCDEAGRLPRAELTRGDVRGKPIVQRP